MKKLVVVMATLATACSVNAMASGVGVVDMKKIFSASPEVKTIKAQLTKQFDPEKTKLEAMGKDLQSDIAKYQKNKDVMNKKDLNTLESTITNQEDKFRDAQGKFQQDVYQAQNERLTQFMTTVKAAVAKVAAKNKLDLVLPDNDVLYQSSNMDITQQVIDDMK